MDSKILFIHHSTGGNLIREGNLRSEIHKLNSDLEFWDHSYNLYPIFSKALAHSTHHRGLTDKHGNLTYTDYNIVLSNNSPREYAEIFSRSPNDKTLTKIFEYDVIAFKNCYPTTMITSVEQFDQDISFYKEIKNSVKRFKTKKFILVTPPPLRRELTTIENAKRAKKLVDWLLSKEFLSDTQNLFVFDFFNLLADENGFLKKEYCRLFPRDSHPNKKANMTIAPLFAEYLVKVTSA